jgi:hypothetical protein
MRSCPIHHRAQVTREQNRHLLQVSKVPGMLDWRLFEGQQNAHKAAVEGVRRELALPFGVAMRGAWLLTAITVSLGCGFGQGDAGRPGCSGHGEKEVLHLRGELPALRFLLCKAIGPVEQAAGVTGRHDLIEQMVLRIPDLVGVNHGRGETEHGKDPEAGGDLEFAVPPADGEQLAARGENEEEQDSEDGEGLLQVHENAA